MFFDFLNITEKKIGKNETVTAFISALGAYAEKCEVSPDRYELFLEYASARYRATVASPRPREH